MAADNPFIASHATCDAFEAVDEACASGAVVLLVADAGRGKSQALVEYAGREDANVLLYRAQVVNTPRLLVRALLWSLGTPWNGTTNAGFAVLRQLVARSGIDAVLVDDAQRLARNTLDMLRALHEATGVALVLAGTMELGRQLRVRRGELAHHVRRVHVLGEAGLSDAIALVNAVGVSRKRPMYWERVAMARVLLEASAGNFRRMVQIMEAARVRARHSHRALCMRHVQGAAESLQPAA